MANGNDILGRQPLQFQGGLLAQNVQLTLANQVNLLAQELRFRFGAETRPFFDMTAPTNVYLVSGRPMGEMDLTHLIGLAPNVLTFFSTYTPISPQDLIINYVPQQPNAQPMMIQFKSAYVTALEGRIAVDDMIIVSTTRLRFIDMIAQ
jgi:hypothetical protein